MNQIIVTSESVSEVVPNILAGLQPEEQWFTAGLSRNWNTDSGQRLSAESSLTYSSVWQATSLISQSVAGLPLEVYAKDSNDDRERLRLHPAWTLLNTSPSQGSEITAFAFKETLQAHALTWGNGYAEIERDNGGRPVALSILSPALTYPDTDADGMLFYWTSNDQRDQTRQIMPRDVFHIKGLSGDGLQGYSVFKMARNSWGLGLAAEKHGNRHFRNNARPNIALKTGAHLNEDQATALRQRFEDRHRGLDAESSTAVLSGGLEIVPFSISNEDSQWLQSRQFQRQEVAAWFNVPPHMLGDSSTTGYNSIQEENRRFLQQTLLPWLRKWASEADLKLLDNRERRAKNTYWEHNLASLIEADTGAVVDQVTQLIASEVITTNEARRRLNMNKREDGKGDQFKNPNITATPDGEDVGEDADTTDSGPSSQNLIDTFNAYGTAVRAGAITPNEVDEKHFRQLADLPSVSPAVGGAWRDEPTRRPVTLQAPATNDPAPPAGGSPAAIVDHEPFNKLLSDRLAHMQDVESKQLQAAARRRKANFEQWADTFFEDWCKRLEQTLIPIAEVWRAVGIPLEPAIVARAHVHNNRTRVLSVYARFPRIRLASAIGDLYDGDLSDWPSQLATLASEDNHVED